MYWPKTGTIFYHAQSDFSTIFVQSKGRFSVWHWQCINALHLQDLVKRDAPKKELMANPVWSSGGQ